MTELSPAAQAVINSAVEAGGGYGYATPVLHARLAAALRAAADQVVPWETWLGTDETCYAYYRQRCNTRRQLFAIANELEACGSNDHD